MKVVVVDSDARRAHARAEQLRLDGLQANAASSAAAAALRLAEAQVVVLGDLEGEAARSLGLLRDIRGGRVADVDTDVRVIAFADSEAQVLSAYAAGADMTLPRSVSATLVSASVSALARRSWRPASDIVRIGELELDRAARTATVAGKEVTLTGTEFDLLAALGRSPGRAFSREELSRELWGCTLAGSRALDAHVSRMARKLRTAGAEPVQNVRGYGYKLNNGREL